MPRGATEGDPPVVLTAPPVEEFLNECPGTAAVAVVDLQSEWRDRAVTEGDPGATESATEITLSADQVNKLRGAARRSSQLANQLLALSRIDVRSDHTQAMQRVELKQLCEVVPESHLNAATGKVIDLGLDCAYAHTPGANGCCANCLAI